MPVIWLWAGWSDIHPDPLQPRLLPAPHTVLWMSVGSNDLDAVDTTVAQVVDNAVAFVQMLHYGGVFPKCIIFLSVFSEHWLGAMAELRFLS